MCRGFPYEIGITCKKVGKICVEGRILRSITLSRDKDARPYAWNHHYVLVRVAYVFHPDHAVFAHTRDLLAGCMYCKGRRLSQRKLPLPATHLSYSLFLLLPLLLHTATLQYMMSGTRGDHVSSVMALARPGRSAVWSPHNAHCLGAF